jgi:GH24 family phage-related lysozyme (muramidase)
MASVSNAVQIAAPFTAGWEQFVPGAYWDTNGYAYGYGNHYKPDGSPVGPDDTIDQTTAYELLTDTLAGIASRINQALTVQASDEMLAALSDLAYNWGTEKVLGSIVLGKINAGASQSDIATQWNITANTSGGVYNADLARRRIAEQQLAFSGSPDVFGMVLIAAVALYILFFSTAKK